MRRALVALMALASLGLVAAPSQAGPEVGPVTTRGYLSMADGVQLRYTLVRPSATGRFPVAINYGPYFNGSDPIGWSAQSARFVGAGYAVLGVNIRGTGCSQGAFGFLNQQESLDAVEVIEWSARQTWSTGHTGMFGLSFPGMSQYGPAALHAPHLDAIAPFQTQLDLYDDVTFPGGMMNVGFASLWALVLQPQASTQGVAIAAQQGDVDCLAHQAQGTGDTTIYEWGVQALQAPFAGPVFEDRSPRRFLEDIDIPVLGCLSWQDEMVSSGSWRSFDVLDPASTWVIGTNGYHGVCDAENTWPYLRAFFDRYVKGDDNGFESTPHVVLFHDAATDPTGSLALMTEHRDTSIGAWKTTQPQWPVGVAPTTLHLLDGGVLGVAGPEHPGQDSYVTPAPGSSTEDGYLGEWHAAWKVQDLPGGSAAYTTPPLAHDAEFFGPGSVDLWLSTTGLDTDLQVTLSEIRPDGHEVYVQRGWLRASHRVLDPARSTALSPVPTHAREDQALLTPGVPTSIRVPIRPFDYVFREGSAIRLTIGTPSLTGLWQFVTNPVPAVNTIWHDKVRGSRLVLGLVPGAVAGGTAKPCDTLLNQPCRPNLVPVPAGSVDVS